MGSNDDAPLSSSVVREAALAWHRDVRVALAKGLRAISAAQAGADDAAGALRACAGDIAATVRRQVVSEDQKLAPVLRELDAWGPLRVERLDALHAREQAAVDRALADDADGQALAARLRASIGEILTVLRIEEKELLDADLLDDSTTVSRGQSGG